MSRTIDEILHFRRDVSPFLVHLTRDASEEEPWLPIGTARERLVNILQQRALMQSKKWVSRVALVNKDPQVIPQEDTPRYFSAVSFTETPLEQVQCLLDIEGRGVDLQPYGLVFRRDRLSQRHVSPVAYLNNASGGIESILKAYLDMCETRPDAAERVVPLVDFFGRRIECGIPQTNPASDYDFSWEREWRLPYCFGNMAFTASDVFIGLCPEADIDEFEELFARTLGDLPGVPVGRLRFIDPRRPLQWFASRLVNARQRMDLPYSVV